MSLDFGELQNDHEKLKEEGDRGSNLDKYVQLPEGKGVVTMRFLPPADSGMFGRDKNPFYQWNRIHRVNGRNLHDPREPVGNRWVGDNPIGHYLRRLWKDSEKAPPDEKERMQNLYRELKPNDRYYFNVVIRNPDGTNSEPLIFSCGKTVFGIVLDKICGDEELGEEKCDITDWKNGFDFILKKNVRTSGTRSWANYDKSEFATESSPAGTPEEIERWKKNLHDLVALRRPATSEELDHHLLCHLGLKQDEGNGNGDEAFDYSRYQTVQEEVTVETTETSSEAPTTATAETTTEKEEPAEPAEGAEVLADDQFLEELRGM